LVTEADLFLTNILSNKKTEGIFVYFNMFFLYIDHKVNTGADLGFDMNLVNEKVRGNYFTLDGSIMNSFGHSKC